MAASAATNGTQPATDASTAPTSRSYKEEGNELFRTGSYLKAAGMYTRAIKESPQDAVLYSNRCAALIKVSKFRQALGDAEECIRLKPEWDKGYFRKASVLEAMEQLDEALAVYQEAAKVSPDNREVAERIRILTRLVKRQKAAAGKANGAANAAQATQ